MTGTELAKVIKREWPDIPVLLATGYADKGIVVHGQNGEGTRRRGWRRWRWRWSDPLRGSFGNGKQELGGCTRAFPAVQDESPLGLLCESMDH